MREDKDIQVLDLFCICNEIRIEKRKDTSCTKHHESPYDPSVSPHKGLRRVLQNNF